MNTKNNISEQLLPLTVDINNLTNFEKNARQGNVDAIVKSYNTFGQRKPIVAKITGKNENGFTGEVIAGNHQLKAAKKLGWDKIAVVFVADDDLTAKAYALADNRTSELGSYDEKALLALINEVSVDELLFDATSIELNELELNEKIKEKLDDIPEPPTEPISKVGDVWQLGNHRLACGDSTDHSIYKLLMQDEKADLIWTDPPFGMDYDGGRGKKNFGKIKNDELQGSNLINLVESALKLSLENSNDCAMYVCLTWRTYSEFEKVMVNINKPISTCIVWNKNSIGLGHGNYRPQHEFLFYSAGKWYGDKSQSDIWNINRAKTQNYQHPTQKPIELIIKSLDNSTVKHQIVLDPFGGSGSTLMACEQYERSARLIELDPKYCDVIISRWENATGLKAVQINKNKKVKVVENE